MAQDFQFVYKIVEVGVFVSIIIKNYLVADWHYGKI